MKKAKFVKTIKTREKTIPVYEYSDDGEVIGQHDAVVTRTVFVYDDDGEVIDVREEPVMEEYTEYGVIYEDMTAEEEAEMERMEHEVHLPTPAATNEELEEAVLELAQNQSDIEDAILELAELIGG